MKRKQYWVIQGWDSCTLLFEHKIYVGQISEKRLRELLKVLTSKVSLSEDEIISSYANRRAKVHFNYLEVRLENGDKYGYSCGTNPFVIATIENE
ncbi:MAG: hypothetical protein M0R33_00070 [Methylomonas sp.]|uniref:hypothetical protein n=1 Tax=Methylomonas sp. TaxID=418 RepID=UPI0025D81797|nr:hypothetical protein [Methylomonas sp.]MCK9604829.1 hypothetical protein [Methylomonas sp.]